MKEQAILNARFKRELEYFFEGVVLGSGKKLLFDGWRGPTQALTAVRKSAL